MLREPWTNFYVDDALIQGAIKKLDTAEDVFSFSQYPQLASLLACLGLQSEMGGVLDRLSPALNIKLSDYKSNPWKSQIINVNNNIGLRMWIDDIEEFYPDHKDFASILHPLSLDNKNRLSQIILFPHSIANNFSQRGLELVIVKQWALSSFLQQENAINYFETNEFEIKNHFSQIQTKMMPKNQLAFMGTHDLVDHLLGGDGRLLASKSLLFNEVLNEYQQIFNRKKCATKNIELVVSYLIGVILDDMAQPKWYTSHVHSYLLIKMLRYLNSLSCLKTDIQSLIPPQSFHTLIKNLRNKPVLAKAELNQSFNRFCADLELSLI